MSEELLGEIVAARISLDGINTSVGQDRLHGYYRDIENGVRINLAFDDLRKLVQKAVEAVDQLGGQFDLAASITTLTNQMLWLWYLAHHLEEWIANYPEGAHPEDVGCHTDRVFLNEALQESVRLHGCARTTPGRSFRTFATSTGLHRWADSSMLGDWLAKTRLGVALPGQTRLDDPEFRSETVRMVAHLGELVERE